MVLAVGVLVAALLTVPPWPMYRRKPLQWRKAKKESNPEAKKEKEAAAAASPAQKAKKKNK